MSLSFDSNINKVKQSVTDPVKLKKFDGSSHQQLILQLLKDAAPSEEQVEGFDHVVTILDRDHLEEADVKALACFFKLNDKDLYTESLKAKDQNMAIKLLDAQKIDPKQALFDACKYGCMDVIKYLIKDKGVSPLIKGAMETTLLMQAVMGPAALSDKKEMVLYLLEAGVDVKSTTASGMSALMMGIHKNVSIDILRILLQAGAEINKPNASGKTALLWALEGSIPKEDKENIVRLLLEFKADPNVVSNEGKRALDIVLKDKPDLALVRLLSAYGANIHHGGSKSYIRSACNENAVEKVAALLNVNESEAVVYIGNLNSKIILSHVNRLTEFEGSSRILMKSFLSRTLGEMDPELSSVIPSYYKEEMIEALELPRTEENVVSSVRSGALTILPCGFKGHTIYLVFGNGYMAICNGGEGRPLDKNTIDVYKIDPEFFTEYEYQSLNEIMKDDSDNFRTYIYELLPGALAPNGHVEGVKDAICTQLEQLSLTKQIVGNCAYDSGEKAITVAPALMTIDRDANGNPSLDPVHVEEARQFSQNFNVQAHITAFSEYSEQVKSVHDQVDKTLADKAWEETSSIVNKTPNAPIIFV